MGKSKGVVIRVSDEVHDYIEANLRGNESYDSCLRNLFFIQPRRGATRKLSHTWLLPKSKEVCKTQSEALRKGTLAAFERGDDEPEKPIKVQWWLT